MSAMCIAPALKSCLHLIMHEMSVHSIYYISIMVLFGVNKTSDTATISKRRHSLKKHYINEGTLSKDFET